MTTPLVTRVGSYLIGGSKWDSGRTSPDLYAQKPPEAGIPIARPGWVLHTLGQAYARDMP